MGRFLHFYLRIYVMVGPLKPWTLDTFLYYFCQLQNQDSSCQEKCLHMNAVKTLFRTLCKEDTKKKVIRQVFIFQFAFLVNHRQNCWCCIPAKQASCCWVSRNSCSPFASSQATLHKECKFSKLFYLLFALGCIGHTQ